MMFGLNVKIISKFHLLKLNNLSHYMVAHKKKSYNEIKFPHGRHVDIYISESSENCVYPFQTKFFFSLKLEIGKCDHFCFICKNRLNFTSHCTEEDKSCWWIVPEKCMA